MRPALLFFALPFALRAGAAVAAAPGSPAPRPDEEVLMSTAEKAPDGAHDFDFWMGRWRVANRRLRERLKGSNEWDTFEATAVARPLPGGLGNEDEYRTDFAGGFVGMTFRFFDPAARTWSLYWADSRRGALDPPVVGRFAGDVGTFEGDDTFEDRRVRVRFVWTRQGEGRARWEQAFSPDGGRTWETNWIMEMTRVDGEAKAFLPGTVAPPSTFGLVEFRRYTIKPGARDAFARRFEAYFPEAIRQVGAVAFGQFLERSREDHFTWIRGFADADARGAANGALYNGALWKELRSSMNEMIVDSDDVLLLSPLAPERGLPVLPEVDPVTEPEGARGVAVAQIFPAKEGRVQELARRLEPAFAAYRATGVREAGVLVSAEGRNTFPQHPVRTDGPYLVWLGLAHDDKITGRLRTLAERAGRTALEAGLLRGEPELVLLDPTRRSRLRWIEER